MRASCERHASVMRASAAAALCSAELHQEWSEDPMEVIRRNSCAVMMAVAEDLYDPRDAAVNLIHDVLKTRALREPLLDPFMEAVLGIAAEFRLCGARRSSRPHACELRLCGARRSSLTASTAHACELRLGRALPGTLHAAGEWAVRAWVACMLQALRRRRRG